MRPADALRFALESLAKMKLRTVLTVSGVTVGVAALAAMVAFGSGMQKNVADAFARLDLFNTVTVLPAEIGPGAERRSAARPAIPGRKAPALDDALQRTIAAWPGVTVVYPEQRIPATVTLCGHEEFSLLMALPADVARPPRFTLHRGRLFAGDDEAAVLVTRTFLHRLRIPDRTNVVGAPLEIGTVSLKGGSPASGLPFGRSVYTVRVAGVIDQSVFGAGPFMGEVIVPAGYASRMERLPFSSLWDLLRAQGGTPGYSSLSVRISAPRYLVPVKERIRALGLTAVAGDDQFAEIRNNFLIMDMVLAAIGMVALFVAALGITNTMVMSILERYREIGVMKAIGAEDGQVRRIFLVESALIGLAGGVTGLLLGRLVSWVINRVVNIFLARQGVPFIDYFHFPLWLCAGSILFAMAIALLSGLYPARRAARVDPVRALRHD